MTTSEDWPHNGLYSYYSAKLRVCYRFILLVRYLPWRKKIVSWELEPETFHKFT